MKKRILFVNPHFSTGGSCSFILKMAEAYKDRFDISICEKSNFGDLYVVQRNIARRDFNFHTLNGDDNRLTPLIKRLNPAVVHLHELPESFLNKRTLNELYSNDREYSIVVTSHSNQTRRKDFTYIPDRIVAVNKWQMDLFCKEFAGEQISIAMWEYPIEPKVVTDRDKNKARFALIEERELWGTSGTSAKYTKYWAWSYDGKNILNVGLFTPGKNQGELFEIARKNPQNHYHFVGNQAGNFAEYWQPLMENKPDNCIIWGERADVELFYQACDEFYFTSKFELNPICVKEALSYGLPVKMRRLPSYGTDYDNTPLVTYIN